MGPTSRPAPRGRGCLTALVLIGLLLGMSQVGTTLARMHAFRLGSVAFQAAPATSPRIGSSVADVGLLEVGDRCENAPLLTVTGTSPWRMQLTVGASGWLQGSDVTIDPTSVTDGQTATVYFTKAAVGPPQPIIGEVVVNAEPGGFVFSVPLSGEVINPAGAASEGRLVREGCVSTPRVDEDTPEPERIFEDLSGEALTNGDSDEPFLSVGDAPEPPAEEPAGEPEASEPEPPGEEPAGEPEPEPPAEGPAGEPEPEPPAEVPAGEPEPDPDGESEPPQG